MELPVSVEVSVVCAWPLPSVSALSGLSSPGPPMIANSISSPATGCQFSPSAVHSNVAVKMWSSPTTFVSLSGVRLSRTSMYSFSADSLLWPLPSVVRTTSVPSANVIVTVALARNAPGVLLLIEYVHVRVSPVPVGPLTSVGPSSGSGETSNSSDHKLGSSPSAVAVTENTCSSPTTFVSSPGVISMYPST